MQILDKVQSKCNPSDIFETVDRLLSDRKTLEKQIKLTQEIISKFKKNNSSEFASKILLNHLSLTKLAIEAFNIKCPKIKMYLLSNVFSYMGA